AYLDRTLSPEDAEELFREMRADADARRYLLLASHTDLALYDLGRARASQRTPARPWKKFALAACLLLGVSGVLFWSLTETRVQVGRIESGATVFAGDVLKTPATVVCTDGTRLKTGADSVLRFLSASEVLLEKGNVTAAVTPQREGRSRIFHTPE